MALPVLRTFNDVARWDPFDVHSRFTELMQAAFNDFTTALPVDLEETDAAYVVEVDLPGVRKEDVAVELRGNELAIRGEFTERERKGVLRQRTRRTGEFDYRMTLPRDIDADNVSAELADGVLRVEIAKVSPEEPRRIEITKG